MLNAASMPCVTPACRNDRSGSKAEVQRGPRTVRSWGQSRHHFRTAGCLLVAISRSQSRSPNHLESMPAHRCVALADCAGNLSRNANAARLSQPLLVGWTRAGLAVVFKVCIFQQVGSATRWSPQHRARQLYPGVAETPTRTYGVSVGVRRCRARLPVVWVPDAARKVGAHIWGMLHFEVPRSGAR